MFHWLHLNTQKTEPAGLTKVALGVPSSWPLFNLAVIWKYGFSLGRAQEEKTEIQVEKWENVLAEDPETSDSQIIFKEVFSTLFLHGDFNQGMSSLSNNQDIPSECGGGRCKGPAEADGL